MPLVTWRAEDNTTKRVRQRLELIGNKANSLLDSLDVPDNYLVFLNGQLVTSSDATEIRHQDQIIIQPRSSVEF